VTAASTVTTCALCDEDAAHGHHLTGRPAPGRSYLDPALVLGVCRHHHVNLHVWLRAVGLAWPSGNTVAYRLRRVAVHLRAVAGQGRPFTLGPRPAEALADLLDEAAEIIEPTATETIDADPDAETKKEVWV